MDKKKFALLTTAGFLVEIGGGVIMIVFGALTELMYTDLLIYAAIGLVVSMAFGVLYSFINRKARLMHVNTPVYTLVVQVLPVTLSICCLMAMPVLIQMKIVSTSMGLVAAGVMTVGTILTATFGAVTTSIVSRVSKKKAHENTRA